MVQQTMDETHFVSQLALQGGVITPSQLEQLGRALSLADDELIHWVLEQTKVFAQAAVSNFHVSALVKAQNGNGELFYAIGVNCEFAQLGLEQSVHAEQCALHNAWLHGATSVERIYVSAMPCGHCRQFINEFDAHIEVSVGETKMSVAELLPARFGPADLGVNSRVLETPASRDASDNNSRLLEHFDLSYAPYSDGKAAVALHYGDHVYYGRYCENAAFNPSLSPLQGALSQLYLHHLDVDLQHLQKVQLIEQKSVKSLREGAAILTRILNPHAEFEYISV